MAPSKVSCSSCDKSFHKEFLIVNDDTALCSFCDIKSMTNGVISALKEQLLNEKKERDSEVAAFKVEINQLKSKLEELQSHSNSGQILAATSNGKSSYASVTSGTLSPIHPSPSSSLIPSSSPLMKDTFLPVKRGPKPKKLEPLAPIPTSNAFSVLEASCSNDEGETNVVLVGDSMLHGQRKTFVKDNINSRVFSYGGASLTGKKRLSNFIDDFTRDTNSNTLFVVHAGTNDLLDKECTSHEILAKYKQMLNSIRERSNSNQICLLGLFPVLSESLKETSERKVLNQLMHEFANDQNILFLSVWEQFACDPNFKSFFNDGGLHLSHWGSKKLRNMLNNFIENFPGIPLNQTRP